MVPYLMYMIERRRKESGRPRIENVLVVELSLKYHFTTR
jgi:hypothetical protein